MSLVASVFLSIEFMEVYELRRLYTAQFSIWLLPELSLLTNVMQCKQEDWIRKTIIYNHVCGQCPTQFMLPNSSRWWLVNMWFYDGKVSLIDGEPIAIILCLHVLIAHRLFINFGYFLLSRFKSFISKIFRYIFHKTTYFQNILLSFLPNFTIYLFL